VDKRLVLVAFCYLFRRLARLFGIENKTWARPMVEVVEDTVLRPSAFRSVVHFSGCISDVRLSLNISSLTYFPVRKSLTSPNNFARPVSGRQGTCKSLARIENMALTDLLHSVVPGVVVNTGFFAFQHPRAWMCPVVSGAQHSVDCACQYSSDPLFRVRS
jgi:hypothetical protein